MSKRFFERRNWECAEAVMRTVEGRYFVTSLLQDLLHDGLVRNGNADRVMTEKNIAAAINSVLYATPEARRLFRLAEDERIELTKDEPEDLTEAGDLV